MAKRFFPLLLILLSLVLPASALSEGLPAPVIVTPPSAKTDLVYTGKSQGLINPGTVENGILLYSDAENGMYSDRLFYTNATNAGTYTVWYKVIGASGHADLPPVSLTVTIQKAPQPDEIPGDVTLPEKTTLPSIPLPMGWAWKDPDQPLVLGDNSVIAVYEDTTNYARTEFPLTVTLTPSDLTYEITAITPAYFYIGTDARLGSSLEEIYNLLPSHSVVLSLTDSNGDQSEREVPFRLREAENPDYDPMTEGEIFDLKGYFPALPENITNPKNLQARIVMMLKKYSIYAIQSLPMTVPFGTPFEELPLPEFVYVSVSDHRESLFLPVTWSDETYYQASYQTIKGTLDLPLPVYLENPNNRQPQARITVLDPPPPAVTLSYSPSGPTNQNVTAVLTPQEPITVTNNNGELSYTFSENGSFTFELAYGSGLSVSLTATVDWIDRESPVITLRGENPQTIQKSSPYTELGADLTDNIDPNIGEKLIIDASAVDAGTPGTYTVTYSAADSAGNQSHVTRTVIVKAPASSSSGSNSSSSPSRPRPSRNPDPEPAPAEPTPAEPAPAEPAQPAQPQPCPRDDTCPLARFPDADRNAWYHDSLHYALEKGLLLGLTDTQLGPEVSTSRAMLTTVLYRMEGSAHVSQSSPFEDVPSESYYAPAVSWAAEQGIVLGYGHGLFGPHDPVTREQLAAILWRHAGSPSSLGELSAFSDAGQTHHYALPALNWAVEQKLLSGKGNGILDPRGPATRAELASILMNYAALATSSKSP